MAQVSYELQLYDAVTVLCQRVLDIELYFEKLIPSSLLFEKKQACYKKKQIMVLYANFLMGKALTKQQQIKKAVGFFAKAQI